MNLVGSLQDKPYLSIAAAVKSQDTAAEVMRKVLTIKHADGSRQKVKPVVFFQTTIQG